MNTIDQIKNSSVLTPLKTYDLGAISKDKKDYYECVIDLENKTFFMLKNASCTARAESFLSETFNIPHWELQSKYRIFFNYTSSEPDLIRLPKKYHKFIQSI